jgi:hypothetical protein
MLSCLSTIAQYLPCGDLEALDRATGRILGLARHRNRQDRVRHRRLFSECVSAINSISSYMHRSGHTRWRKIGDVEVTYNIGDIDPREQDENFIGLVVSASARGLYKRFPRWFDNRSIYDRSRERPATYEVYRRVKIMAENVRTLVEDEIWFECGQP